MSHTKENNPNPDADIFCEQIQSDASFDINIKSLYGRNTTIYEHPLQQAPERSSEICVVQQLDLFPGAILIFQDIHVEHLDFQGTRILFPPDILSIQHCKEGRFEGAYRNGECFYLGPGDLSINMPMYQPDHNHFPLSHYHGLNLIINPKIAQKHIADLEHLTGALYIDFKRISDRLREGNHLITYRENVLEHILSELYCMRTDAPDGQIKIKVLELLYHLCSLETASPIQPPYFNRSQVRIIKAIHAYLTDHPERHDTLEELSNLFDIPLTSMKICFKGVYGLSVGAYLRDYRLQLAAELLKENTCSIGDIAFRVGYESPSKFTEAFRKKFSCTPSDYRKSFFGSF